MPTGEGVPLDGVKLISLEWLQRIPPDAERLEPQPVEAGGQGWLMLAIRQHPISGDRRALLVSPDRTRAAVAPVDAVRPVGNGWWSRSRRVDSVVQPGTVRPGKRIEGLRVKRSAKPVTYGPVDAAAASLALAFQGEVVDALVEEGQKD